jgi:hypothetical protein
MADFWKAESEIQEMASDLIANYHPEIATAEIAYLKKDRATTKEVDSGLVVTAKKVSGLYYTLTGETDFVVIIAADLWQELGPDERFAALDSALTSCTAKITEDGEFEVDDAGNPKWAIKPYDIIEHLEIIQRYGIDVLREKADSIYLAIKEPEEKDEQPVADEGTKGTSKSKK